MQTIKYLSENVIELIDEAKVGRPKLIQHKFTKIGNSYELYNLSSGEKNLIQLIKEPEIKTNSLFMFLQDIGAFDDTRPITTTGINTQMILGELEKNGSVTIWIPQSKVDMMKRKYFIDNPNNYDYFQEIKELKDQLKQRIDEHVKESQTLINLELRIEALEEGLSTTKKANRAGLENELDEAHLGYDDLEGKIIDSNGKLQYIYYSDGSKRKINFVALNDQELFHATGTKNVKQGERVVGPHLDIYNGKVIDMKDQKYKKYVDYYNKNIKGKDIGKLKMSIKLEKSEDIFTEAKGGNFYFYDGNKKWDKLKSKDLDSVIKELKAKDGLSDLSYYSKSEIEEQLKVNNDLFIIVDPKSATLDNVKEILVYPNKKLAESEYIEKTKEI